MNYQTLKDQRQPMTLRQSVKLISKELKCKDSLLMKSKNAVTWLLLKIKNSKKSV
jgi:hypothetical protein